MALVLADRVKVRSQSTGTGSFVLADTLPGFQSFAVIGNGNETYYGIIDNVGNWEIGRGTYLSTGPTLSRDTIVSSSAGGAKVNFPAGGKNVFVTFPASLAESYLISSTALASDSFKYVAVSGQTTLSADSSTDTLTVVAGNNVSLTTNAGSDALTIAVHELKGSVFGDDSSKIVDAVENRLYSNSVTATQFIKFPVYSDATARDTALPDDVVEAGMVVFVTATSKLQINTDGTTGGWTDLN